MNKQQILEQIDELKQKIEVLEKEVNLPDFEGIKKNIREYIKRGQKYYYLDSDGNIQCTEWNGTEADLFRHKSGNIFLTEQEAEDFKENILNKQALKDLALKLNEMESVDWDNCEQWKFYIYFNHSTNQLCTNSHSLGQNLLMTYCLNKDFLDIAKERIGEEKLIKLIKSGV